MPRYIIKIKDCYLHYSTIVDAPVTFGMTLDEFKEYYREEYGEGSMLDLEDRLARVEQKGTSAHRHSSVADTLCLNRAGPGGSELTLDEIYHLFCERED